MRPDEPQEEQDKSAYNMAIAYLQRIDELLKLCNESSINNRVDVWFHAVKALYRELCPFMNYKKKEEIEKLLDRCYKSQTDLRTKQPIKSFDSNLLGKAEILLRELMSRKGLLVPKADDPSQAVLK
tara:strand:+ start:115 stop:492 length:378 start_codon:yes stop_codon:yes gene_type:complete